MKWFLLLILFCTFFFNISNSYAAINYRERVNNDFCLNQDKKLTFVAQARCPMCGMNSSKSEVPCLVVFKDGNNKLACGINCAVLFSKKENVVTIKARDYNTKKWIDATKAFYVDGSKQIPKGTMYPFVWSFASKEKAKEFVNRQGGNVLTFKEISGSLPCNSGNKKDD